MAAIKGIEFGRWIASRRPQGIFAFCGPELVLRAEALEALRRRLSEGPAGGARYAVETCTIGEIDVQQLSAIASQGGLFGGERLILVEGLERLTRVRKQSDRDAWAALFKSDPANTMVLMTTLTSRELGGKSAWIAGLLKASQVVDFWSLFPRDAARWLVERSRRDGVQLEPAAAGYLVQHLGADLGLLSRELERIALLHGTGRVKLGDLRGLVRSGALGSSWECVEAILAGRAGEAIERLQGVRHEEASFSFAWKLVSATRNALLELEGEAGSGRSAPTPDRRPAAGVTPTAASAAKVGLARLLVGCYRWECHLKQGQWLGPHDYIGLESLAAAHALRAASAARVRS